MNGSGIEIGALYRPLPLPDHIHVKYLDYETRERSIDKFPELNSGDIVDVDFIDNGFIMNKVPGKSQGFIIANYVLEHFPNFYGTLDNWTRVLKQDGVIFMSLPIAEHCFDKGSEFTSLNRMIEDYKLYCDNQSEQIINRNKKYLKEFRIKQYFWGMLPLKSLCLSS